LPDIALSFEANSGEVQYLTPFADPKGRWGGMGTGSSASCDVCGVDPRDEGFVDGEVIGAGATDGGGLAVAATISGGGSIADGGSTDVRGVAVPLAVADAGAFLGAFGGVLDELAEAGGTFLHTAADQIEAGAKLFAGVINDGARLAASSLTAATQLLASGVAGGEHSVTHLINGFGNALAAIDFGIGDGAANLPAAAAILRTFGSIAGGLSDAGGILLDVLRDGMLSGAGVLYRGINGTSVAPASGDVKSGATAAGATFFDIGRKTSTAPTPPTRGIHRGAHLARPRVDHGFESGRSASLASANAIPSANARLIPVTSPVGGASDTPSTAGLGADRDSEAAADVSKYTGDSASAGNGHGSAKGKGPKASGGEKRRGSDRK
jgi:hypothetical protein